MALVLSVTLRLMGHQSSIGRRRGNRCIRDDEVFILNAMVTFDSIALFTPNCFVVGSQGSLGPWLGNIAPIVVCGWNRGTPFPSGKVQQGLCIDNTQMFVSRDIVKRLRAPNFRVQYIGRVCLEGIASQAIHVLQ